MLSGNSLGQTVHTYRASVHQAAKLVAALLRVAMVTAGLAESSDSLPPGLWLMSPAGWVPRTGISSGTLRSVIEYGLPLPLPFTYPNYRTQICSKASVCTVHYSFSVNCQWQPCSPVGSVIRDFLQDSSSIRSTSLINNCVCIVARHLSTVWPPACSHIAARVRRKHMLGLTGTFYLFRPPSFFWPTAVFGHKNPWTENGRVSWKFSSTVYSVNSISNFTSQLLFCSAFGL